MKKIVYIIAMSFLLGLSGCREAEYKLFDDVARLQINETKDILVDFYYLDKSVGRDTAYITVDVLGGPVNRERKMALKQIREYDIEYKYDEKGNLLDSVLTEKPYKAVPAVHYVGMDDEEMLRQLVVRPNAVSVEIPVILLRDTSLKTHEYRLCLELVETADFQLGERGKLSATVVLADRLTKPMFWSPSVDKYYFGTYSTRKHEFMLEVLQTKIDDAFWEKLKQDYAEMTFTRDKLKDALAEYNADPENIASGLAPMREKQDDPNSALVVFP